MENASKALLIAAGILVGLIVISMILISYNEISGYYESKEKARTEEQLIVFNKQYIPYNRENVRGSELLSLINKIIDFNTLSEEELITISIKIPNDSNENAKLFYYSYDKTKTIKLITLGKAYTHNNIREILDPANEIESNYTQALATKLAANMSTLMGENTRKTKRDLLVELKMIKPNDTYTRPDDIVDNEEILKYYQYQQFKRAHFNCTSLKYTEQGRVKSFDFEFNGTFE